MEVQGIEGLPSYMPDVSPLPNQSIATKTHGALTKPRKLRCQLKGPKRPSDEISHPLGSPAGSRMRKEETKTDSFHGEKKV